jgi:hypothetical protein
VLLQTGAAYVNTERINILYRVILLGMDNVESCARRAKSWRKMPVALCVTEVKCLVNRSILCIRSCAKDLEKYLFVCEQIH